MTDQTTKIPNGWKITALEEVTDKIGDGLHGTPEYSNNGEYFFINGNNIGNGKIVIKDDTNKVDREEFEKYKKDLGKNTILLSINGTIGNLAKYKNEKCILGKSAAYINVKNENSQDFVYYFMLDRRFQRDISKNANGSTIKNVSLAQLRNYSFILPPLPEQCAIAAVLSSLDDKIELLQAQNKTLGNIARILFKRWFVEFEFPNKDGNPYKSSGGKLIDTELGKIPDGWRFGILGDILSNIESGSRPKGGIDSNLKNGIPSVGAESIDGIGSYNFSSTKYVTKGFFESMRRGIVMDYDVLIYKDGAYVGKKAMFGLGFPFDVFAVNEHVFILRANEIANQFFLYFLLKQEELSQLNTNSAQPGLNQESMKNLTILIPPLNLMDKFGGVSKGLIDKILMNSKQIKTLSTLRDTLLPKLMKGEVRVSNYN